MDLDAKRQTLRMIPYGTHVITADAGGGDAAAATVNWAMQTSFNPPMIAVAVKADSEANRVARQAGAFALNALGKGTKGVAFAFYKPSVHEPPADGGPGTLSGHPYRAGGSTGQPILEAATGALECRIVETVERGDHHILIAEIADAVTLRSVLGRPDAAALTPADLGSSVFYGG